MALVFERFVTEEMGAASYLVGDDSAAVAAVVDPQLDIDRYLECARHHGLAIGHVLQTHIHEDFVSGACALAAATGAQVGVSGHDAPPYRFAHRLLHDGDRIELGSVTLSAKHTPGHTPEHLAFLVAQGAGSDAPFAVFSGGALLVGAAGRTDLLGPGRVDALTRAQFATLRTFFLRLDDGVMVFPTHVHGSPCGAAIGDKMSTTIGYERRHNPLLQHDDGASFHAAALADLPPKPGYYPRLKDRNTDAPALSAVAAAVRPLPAAAFKRAAEGDCVVVDTRDMLAFGGGHIPGAINIGAAGHLSIWAGWMLDPAKPLLLVLASDSQLPAVLRQFAGTGFERFAGYLAGGMSAWDRAGQALQPLPQLPAATVARQLSAATTVLDVRSPQEWGKGHIPGARHVFLPDLPAAAAAFDKRKPLTVYCDSGYRASLGASLLQAAGFDVSSLAGGWQGWTAGDLPVEVSPR